jgi:nitroreductase
VRGSLDAGGPAGSAKNRRPWRFLVLGDRGRVDRVAQSVYVSPELLGAPRVIAIVVSGKFRSLRRAARGPEHHAGRVDEGGRPLSERNREPESLGRAARTQGA